jgi:hypothetical protein
MATGVQDFVSIKKKGRTHEGRPFGLKGGKNGFIPSLELQNCKREEGP